MLMKGTCQVGVGGDMQRLTNIISLSKTRLTETEKNSKIEIRNETNIWKWELINFFW